MSSPLVSQLVEDMENIVKRKQIWYKTEGIEPDKNKNKAIIGWSSSNNFHLIIYQPGSSFWKVKDGFKEINKNFISSSQFPYWREATENEIPPDILKNLNKN